MTKTYVFRTPFARRMPDPNFKKPNGIDRYIFMMPVGELPSDIPYDPNARIPAKELNKRVHKQIRNSLLNGADAVPGAFHLKHKGITIVAREVRQRKEDEYAVVIDDGDGLLDGGHTYRIITDLREEGILPENQFVKVEVLTNIPEEWITEIAGGLNTSVQVEAMSLANLASHFEWIKSAIAGQPYESEIAWKEGQDGEVDARDIISIMTCFNVDLFPNHEIEQPVMAYEKKSLALEKYLESQNSYKKLRPILLDILKLHDIIRRDYRENYTKAMGGKAGGSTISEYRKKGFVFPFTGKSSEYRLTSAALFPILAAFRWFVEKDPKKEGSFRWKGGFKNVLKRWEETSPDLIKLTIEQNKESGRTPNALGKSRPHWRNLHTHVAKSDLENRMGGSAD